MFLDKFFNKEKITVNVKLLAGLDSIEGYDRQTGITLELVEGAKLKKALRRIDLPHDSSISYIVNGEPAASSVRLKDGDEVFCFYPLAGG